MSNQDTPNIDGWPFARRQGALIQATPVPAPGVLSNDATNPPGGLQVPSYGVQFTGLYPSQGGRG